MAGALWLALPCSALAGTTITTVAGGDAPTGALAPAGVAQTLTTGVFRVVDKNGCRVRVVSPSGGLDTGPMTSIAGTVCSPSGNEYDGTEDAGGLTTAFTDAVCCVTLADGVNNDYLIADDQRVHLISSNLGKIRTLAGRINFSAASCEGDTTPPADGSPAVGAPICRVADIAASLTTDRFLLVEMSDRAGGSLVYEVDYTTITAPTIKKVAGGGCPTPDGTPAAEVCLGPGTFGFKGFSVAYDGAGFLVADGEQHVIRRFSSTDFATSTVSVVAGSPGTPGSTDGDADTAGQLNNPVDVRRNDRDGSWFIADAGNCRIRRVGTDGQMTTIAGTVCNSNGNGLGDGGPAENAVLTAGRLAYSDAGLYVTDPIRGRIRLIDKTSFLSAPPAYTQSTDATFTYASLDSPAQFLCQLDDEKATVGPPIDVYSDCTTQPNTLTGLSEGTHSLDVVTGQVSPQRLHDPTPARWTWTVDHTAPEPFAVTAPANAGTGVSTLPTVTWDAAADATAGVDHYELTLDGAPVGGSLGCCSYQVASALAEGPHTAGLRAVDKAGNTRDSGTVSFDVGVAPAAAFTIAPNPVLPGSSVTFTSTATDADGPIARHEWDLDGDGTYETEGAQVSRSYPTPGTVTVGQRVTDGGGRTATTTATLTVSGLLELPKQIGVTVNNGAQYTNDPDVTVNITFPAGISTMLVSNDGGFLAPASFPPAAEVEWKLDSSGPERLPKTVYVRFLTGTFPSETFTDDIILDETPPKVSSASVTNASAATASAAAKKKRKYKLKLRASDNVSGVAGVQITANKKKPGKLLKYKRSMSVRATSSKLHVRAKDKAGNYSRWRKAKR